MQSVTGFATADTRPHHGPPSWGSIARRCVTHDTSASGRMARISEVMALVKRLWDTVSARFDDDNAEWGLSRRTAISLPRAVRPCLRGGRPSRSGPPSGSSPTRTASPSGVSSSSSIVLIVIYARLSIALWRQGQRPLALLYASPWWPSSSRPARRSPGASAIFRWLTPGALEDINNQGETNIHNIGPVLKILNLVIMAVAFVAAACRWCAGSSWRDRARSIAGYALIPPAALIPAFGMEFSYRAIRLLFLPTPRYTLTKLSEIAELSFYFGLFVFGLLAWRVIVSGWRPASSGRLRASARRPTTRDPRRRRLTRRSSASDDRGTGPPATALGEALVVASVAPGEGRLEAVALDDRRPTRAARACRRR